jgi:hypothetical protein
MIELLANRHDRLLYDLPASVGDHMQKEGAVLELRSVIKKLLADD